MEKTKRTVRAAVKTLPRDPDHEVLPAPSTDATVLGTILFVALSGTDASVTMTTVFVATLIDAVATAASMASASITAIAVPIVMPWRGRSRHTDAVADSHASVATRGGTVWSHRARLTRRAMPWHIIARLGYRDTVGHTVIAVNVIHETRAARYPERLARLLHELHAGIIDIFLALIHPVCTISDAREDDHLDRQRIFSVRPILTARRLPVGLHAIIFQPVTLHGVTAPDAVAGRPRQGKNRDNYESECQ